MEKPVIEKNKNRSKWFSILETLQNQEYKIITALIEDSKFSKTENGLSYMGSELHFYDNGNLSLRNKKNEGFFISSKKNTALINSKNIVLNADNVSIKTRPAGFKLNGYYLNPDVLKNATVTITRNNTEKNVPLFIKEKEDNEIKNLLEEFGVL